MEKQQKGGGKASILSENLPESKFQRKNKMPGNFPKEWGV